MRVASPEEVEGSLAEKVAVMPEQHVGKYGRMVDGCLDGRSDLAPAFERHNRRAYDRFSGLLASIDQPFTEECDELRIKADAPIVEALAEEVTLREPAAEQPPAILPEEGLGQPVFDHCDRANRDQRLADLRGD
jgi:hypothetical protein